MFAISRTDSQDTLIASGRASEARFEAPPPPSRATPFEKKAEFHRAGEYGQAALSALLAGGGAAVGLVAPRLGVAMGVASAAAAGAALIHSQEAAAAERQAAEIREGERKDAEAKAAAEKKEMEKRESEKADQAAAAAKAAKNEREARDFREGLGRMRGETYGGRASAVDRDRSDSISRTC